ncbi:MAG: sigma-E processing peptidase SpoIIGA, partial [Clostridiales bacterium]|nr:sigma-E processing peptidase SpoIIGA [Clostridiales bacterium]
AALYPFLHVNAALMLFIKAGAAGAAVFLLYAFRNARKYFAAYIAFVFITFLFGGAAYAFMNLPFGMADNLDPNRKDAAAAVLCAAAFVGYFLISFIKRLHKTRDAAGYVKKIGVFLNGKQADFTAFLDTGNQLYDPVGGLPVIPIERAAFIKAFKIFSRSDKTPKRKAFDILNLSDKAPKSDTSQFSILNSQFPKGRYIRLATAAGAGKIFIFKPDKILIYSDKCANKIVTDAMIGLYEGVLSKTGDYQGLLHSGVL